MCGIVGIWHRDGNRVVDRAVLVRMADTLAHRGPDDSGVFAQGSFGMAHRRLSILDLSSAGRQPMVTVDERYYLVFNGEIYNYRELKERYLSGVKLKSSSDSEVLLHLMALKGAGALPLLRGMFALAFWDRQEQELLLARDPFGKKPLYYTQQADSFLFASEPKALLASGQVSREMDPAAAIKYFLYEYVPAPATGYQAIQQLPMGHLARVRKRSFDVQQWWKPRYRSKYSFKTEQEALNVFDEKLTKAVERRMISDVPVGLLLSGGLDSTAIGWYMRQCSTSLLHSFSASFEDKSFDESRYASLAAKSLGMQHHDLLFDLDSFRGALEEIVGLMDVPFGDASLLPTYAVSKLARSKITVALDGDGSDELLGGYGTFQAAEVADRLPRLPRWTADSLSGLVRHIPTSFTNFSLDFKVKSFVEGLSYPRALRNQIWLGSFTDIDLTTLLTPDYRKLLKNLFEDIDEIRDYSDRLSTFDAVSWLKVHHYLQNDIMVKLDRATMFTSLEARTPFLDVDVAEFLMRLPVHLKRRKYILKRLMRGRIPDAIIDRPKRGFGVPVGFWLRGPLYDWARDVLGSDKLRRDGVLVPAQVDRLLYEHKAGRADHRKKLWTLLAWQLWHDQWIK